MFAAIRFPAARRFAETILRVTMTVPVNFIGANFVGASAFSGT